MEEVPLVTHSEALTALSTLRSYEEQQPAGDLEFGRILRAQERVYLLRRSEGLAQSSLAGWLTNGK